MSASASSGWDSLKLILALAVGIAAAMFRVWGILYSPRGNFPRYAVRAAVFTGIAMGIFLLWAYLKLK